MAHTDSPAETERYATCRNLVWEVAADGEKHPGRYCDNRLGVIHYFDCPVYQGLECCLFDPGEGEPEAAGAEVVDEVKGRLTEDYLRWPYWRRVNSLRGPEAPPDARKKVAAGPEEDDREQEELAELVRHQTQPLEKGGPVEKYPGQHRSEDRRAKQEPGEKDPLEQILDGDLFAEGEEEPPGEPAGEPAPEKKAGDGELPGSSEKPASTGRPGNRRRRRGRRSRGRGKGKKPPPKDGS